MTQAMQRQQAVTIHKNEVFALTAEQLQPQLIYRDCKPKQIIRVVKNELAVHGWQSESIQGAEALSAIAFGKGEEVILDFGEHLVGRLAIRIIPIGSPRMLRYICRSPSGKCRWRWLNPFLSMTDG